MTCEDFINRLQSLLPNLTRVPDVSWNKFTVLRWSKYSLIEMGNNSEFLMENLNNRVNESIKIGNFQINKIDDYLYENSFKEEGFYPFGAYMDDYLFIKIKTKRIEARDLVLTKYYDVAKNEEAFLEAFLVFAKHYAYSLENPMEQPDYYSLYLSISLDQRREILKGVLKIVGGKKYGPFWVQVFQGWTDEELKEMGE